MTPIGHTLTGLAVGYAVMPGTFTPRAKAATLGVFALLAFVPDLPFPGWGHDRYYVSHSVFVTTLGVALVEISAVLLLKGSSYLTWPLLAGGAVTWYSHLLLDTLQPRQRACCILAVQRYARRLPIPWFSTMKLNPLFSWHNLRVFAIEGAVYGMILLVVVVAKDTVFARGRSSSR